MTFSWDLRIARASELSKTHSAVAELLGFYQSLARFQKSVYQSVASSSDHDVSRLTQHFPALIALIRQAGSPALKETAVELEQASAEERLELLQAFWQHQAEVREIPAEYEFFANALLQPFAEYLAEQTDSSTEASPPLCPFCGSKPQLAVLRPEGDGAKRFLCVLFAGQNGFFAGSCALTVLRKIRTSFPSSWPRSSTTCVWTPAIPATPTSSPSIFPRTAMLFL